MKIAIVGGGVAGASVAIYLRSLGVDVTLFEKKQMLIAGPPACHLHAGGNLYPDIDDTQRLRLLRESIEFVRFYPQAIEGRPTALAVPVHIPLDPKELEQRAFILAQAYGDLVAKDPKAKVLGDPEHYVLSFNHKQLQELQELPTPKVPQNHLEWMISFAKEVALTKLKYPVLLVQEYGINIFRLSAIAQLLLQDATIHYGTKVVDAKHEKGGFKLTYEKNGKRYTQHFDFLINAMGFESGYLDNWLGYKKSRLVEFKAAYVASYRQEHLYPEMIFHGIRGTDRGMAQFTPYSGGYYQLHGMRKDITLFEDGVAKSSEVSSQPKLPQKYIDWIEKGWPREVALHRTQRAIEYVSRYMLDFKRAQPTPTPLYGAQQIPGDNLTLRAAEVSFEGDRYARCEIVKVSSILSMADAIVQKLIALGALDPSRQGGRIYPKPLPEAKIDSLAKEIAKARGYPEAMAKIAIPFCHSG